MWVLVGVVRAGDAVVFDVDGVLIDPSARLERARRMSGGDRRRFWELFLDPEAALELDRPNPEAARLARELAARYQVIVVTGRPRHMSEATVTQLRRAGVPFSAVFFRAGREPAPAYKRGVLEWLVENGVRVVEVHDDSERVLEEARRVFGARLVLWASGRPQEYYITGDEERTSVSV